MALLPPVQFEGTFMHPQTGEGFPYAGTCVVAIDSQGRESMHVRGRIKRGGTDAPLVVLGHVDRGRSFVGRETDAVCDFIAAEWARDERSATRQAVLEH